MSVAELKARLDAGGAPPVLLDVREPWELGICTLPGTVHIPMGQVSARIGELDPARETVVICHHGVRSFHVARLLQAQGFGNVVNLRGGVDAWAREIDIQMATY